MIFKVVENISVARRSLNIRLFLGIPIFIISSSTQSVRGHTEDITSYDWLPASKRQAGKQRGRSKQGVRETSKE